MPRIYDGESNPIDFCRDCFPSEEEALDDYGEGEGPDDRGNCFGYDASHPLWPEEGYVCEICGKVLEGRDN